MAATSLVADDQTTAKESPLFADNELLELTITAPFTNMMRERSADEEAAATLSYRDVVDGEVVLDVGIRTRGRFRKQKDICTFTPLRINFKKGATKGTLFKKIDKVKLVTHCRDGSRRYSQSVLREYLAYRILNTMTDDSFRVRLLHVTYIDTNPKKRQREDFAFFIEPDDRLEKRLGLKVQDVPKTTISSLDGAHTNLVSVFQYLIGNTDFSPIKAPEGEPCCHNHVLLGTRNDSMLSIPYDFDMSGFVDAPHSAPNPRFRLRNVRIRLYRGRCMNNARLATTLQAYTDRKADIYTLLSGLTQLSDQTRRKVKRYIDDFYATIEDPKRVNARLEEKCI